MVSVVWGTFFELPLRSCLAAGERSACPPNLFACDDLPVAVDCDAHVARAKRVFETICPGKAFLPSEEEENEDAASDAETDLEAAA